MMGAAFIRTAEVRPLLVPRNYEGAPLALSGPVALEGHSMPTGNFQATTPP